MATSTRGRKPGTPKTGGRQKGMANKATRELKELAAEYTEEAVLKLVEQMRHAENETVQHNATLALLDRAHGKPRQAVDLAGTGENGAMQLEVTIKHFGKTNT